MSLTYKPRKTTNKATDPKYNWGAVAQWFPNFPAGNAIWPSTILFYNNTMILAKPWRNKSINIPTYGFPFYLLLLPTYRLDDVYNYPLNSITDPQVDMSVMTIPQGFTQPWLSAVRRQPIEFQSRINEIRGSSATKAMYTRSSYTYVMPITNFSVATSTNDAAPIKAYDDIVNYAFGKDTWYPNQIWGSGYFSYNVDQQSRVTGCQFHDIVIQLASLDVYNFLKQCRIEIVFTLYPKTDSLNNSGPEYVSWYLDRLAFRNLPTLKEFTPGFYINILDQPHTIQSTNNLPNDVQCIVSPGTIRIDSLSTSPTIEFLQSLPNTVTFKIGDTTVTTAVTEKYDIHMKNFGAVRVLLNDNPDNLETLITTNLLGNQVRRF